MTGTKTEETSKMPETVLLAEDSPEDAFFIRRALGRASFGGTLLHVVDGQEAINYLEGNESFSDRERFPLPDLILTDLKMPRVGGFELMQWIRNKKEFSELPVAVLTSSHLERDRQQAQRLGACAYLVKDILLRGNEELVEALTHCASQNDA